jgi:hypothetical protein
MAFFIGRRYGDFNRLHKRLRTELPGKVLPPMPRKNKQSSVASNLMSGVIGSDDDASSLSSVSTMGALGVEPSLKNLTVQGEKATFLTLVPLLIWQRPSQICFWNFDGSTFSQIFHGCPAIAWR